MKFEIYRGSFGEPQEVIYTGEGNWQTALKELGFLPNKYCSIIILDENQHIDFGSWSVFVKIFN